MREEDIRPAGLMADKSDCVVRDRRFLLDRRDRFVETACPACDETAPRPAFAKDGFAYEWCSTCGTLYMNPRPSRELMHEFYACSANYEYWNKHIFPATEPARRENIFQPRAMRLGELCARRGVKGGTIVEVGAGFGTFCEELRKLELFDRIIAVEPVGHLAETCRARGIETHGVPIERFALQDGRADVVAAFEVVEHLFSPAFFLDRAARILRPGGLLVLTCPNVMGFDVMTLGSASSVIDHEHVNYFHPRSIGLLLRRHQLCEVEVETPGRLDAELVRKKILAGEHSVGRQPFLRRVLVDEWERLGGAFQDFLAAHQLSSHLWVVAAKPETD